MTKMIMYFSPILLYFLIVFFSLLMVIPAYFFDMKCFNCSLMPLDGVTVCIFRENMSMIFM